MEKETEMIYPDTPGIKKLVTSESPKEVLSVNFPRHQWPISGGWGYTEEDAVVIELDKTDQGVGFEYEFVQFRTYLESIVLQPEGQKLAKIQFKLDRQYLVCGKNGKFYDKVVSDVTAFLESDFEMLRLDWMNHNSYSDDPEGFQKHLELAKSKEIKFKVTTWFDITRFFGKY